MVWPAATAPRLAAAGPAVVTQTPIAVSVARTAPAVRARGVARS